MISLYKSLLNVLVIISNLADVNERRDDFSSVRGGERGSFKNW